MPNKKVIVLGEKEKKLSPDEFVRLAFERLIEPGCIGLHTLYSGFNDAFRLYFSGLDPVKEIKKLENAGKVTMRITKGGSVVIYAGELAAGLSGAQALMKMGLLAEAVCQDDEKWLKGGGTKPPFRM